MSEDRARCSWSLAGSDEVVEFGQDARRYDQVAGLRDALSDRVVMLVGLVEERDQG